MIDYYNILGIEFGVDFEEIKKAYKKKALEFHPDKNKGEKYYEEKFIEIQNAYNILKDSNTKEEYDKQYQFSIEHLIYNVKNFKSLPEEKLPDYVKGFYEQEIRQYNKKLSELYCNHKILDSIFYKSWALSQFYLFHTYSPKFEKWEDEIKYFRDAIGKDILEILKNPTLLTTSQTQEDFINLYLQELVEKDINKRTKEQIEFSFFFLSDEKRKKTIEILLFEYLNIVSRYSSYLQFKNKIKMEENKSILSQSISEVKSIIASRGLNSFKSGGVWVFLILLPLSDEDKQNREIILNSLQRDSTNTKISNINDIIEITKEIIKIKDYSDANLRGFSYTIIQLQDYVKDDKIATVVLDELNKLYLLFIRQYYQDTKDNMNVGPPSFMMIHHLKETVFKNNINIQSELDKILDYEKVSDKRCFIATACYDDYNSEEVIVLRNFRDNKLQKSFVGKIFVRLYYQISPTLANFIYKHDGLKSFIRRHILDRIVAIVDTI